SRISTREADPMRLRHGWLWLWLWLPCSSCQTLQIPAPTEASFRAGELWEKGQAAMQDGQVDEAIRLYQQSLASDPEMVCNHLSLAVAHLEKKNEIEACLHLGKYLEANPEQPMLRSRYAELLLRLHRLSEARTQFEQLVVDLQEQKDPVGQRLIHCH